jgi:hypothetical protein
MSIRGLYLVVLLAFTGPACTDVGQSASPSDFEETAASLTLVRDDSEPEELTKFCCYYDKEGYPICYPVTIITSCRPSETIVWCGTDVCVEGDDPTPPSDLVLK